MILRSLLIFLASCIVAVYNGNTVNKSIGNKPILGIIGGKDVIFHVHRFQVAINVEHIEGSITFCGGTLISPSYVLTAAHCLESVYSLEIILGARNITKNEKTQLKMRTKDFTIHPQWNKSSLLHDIAVIKLPKPVKTNLILRPIDLPKDDKNDYAGHYGVVTGWGVVQINDTGSDVLEYGKSIILSNVECKKIHPFEAVIKETHLCLNGSDEISTCGGDSGGALVVGHTQVGIVSFSEKQCNPKKPSVFTRVSKYLDWIKTNTDLGHKSKHKPLKILWGFNEILTIQGKYHE